MTATVSRVDEAIVRAGLDTVLDPELDEPITELGFVRSVEVAGDAVTVHLRLPTSFCSPNFAYLMASDAKDAVRALAGVGEVTVELDDHHDSGLINRGLAADAGYRGTFRHEAEESLDELRAVFRRKSHTAAMERVLTPLVDAGADPAAVVLGDVPAGKGREALIARRSALDLDCGPDARVLVTDDGTPVAPERAGAALRRARSVRISIDGNAHFCRGLLATRYPGSEHDQTPRPDDDSTTRRVLPLITPERTRP